MSIILTGFAILFVMILVLRIPIAFAMGIVGFFGFAVLSGLGIDNLTTFRWNIPLSLAANRIIDTAQNYGLSIIPLFILMGNLITRSGLSRELYNASYAFLGHRKGGLAMTTVVACGGFSVVRSEERRVGRERGCGGGPKRWNENASREEDMGGSRL